jgi:uncharacterized protein YjbI with pentapeptide repeats
VGVDVSEAFLQGIDLSHAELLRAEFRAADLRTAKFEGARMQYANLRSANLRNASLQGADLRKAHLQDADLYGAELQETNLSEADLPHADLRNAKWQNVAGVSEAYVFGVGNVPSSFLDWAMRNGAVSVESDAAWLAMQEVEQPKADRPERARLLEPRCCYPWARYHFRFHQSPTSILPIRPTLSSSVPPG